MKIINAKEIVALTRGQSISELSIEPYKKEYVTLDDLKIFIAKDNFDGALSTHNLLQELGLTELDIDWSIGELH